LKGKEVGFGFVGETRTTPLKPSDGGGVVGVNPVDAREFVMVNNKGEPDFTCFRKLKASHRK